MKDIAGAVVVFFLCLFAFTKFVGPLPVSISSVTTQKTDTFTVSGEGKVTMIPDIAVVNIGVTAQGPNVSAVQKQLNIKMNAVTDSIKRLGVDAKDIQTSNYNISPMYDYSSSSQRVTGYQANSNLTIKVRKIDNANSVIDAATTNGANQVGGISFDVDDKTKAENQAREQAVADAKSKATVAAKAAGFHLGRIINYSEGGNSSPRPVMMMDKAMPVSAGAGAPTQVEPGTSELTLTVSLSYQID
jgi:uncharacterized protein YggE